MQSNETEENQSAFSLSTPKRTGTRCSLFTSTPKRKIDNDDMIEDSPVKKKARLGLINPNKALQMIVDSDISFSESEASEASDVSDVSDVLIP